MSKIKQWVYADTPLLFSAKACLKYLAEDLTRRHKTLGVGDSDLSPVAFVSSSALSQSYKGIDFGLKQNQELNLISLNI